MPSPWALATAATTDTIVLTTSALATTTTTMGPHARDGTHSPHNSGPHPVMLGATRYGTPLPTPFTSVAAWMRACRCPQHLAADLDLQAATSAVRHGHATQLLKLHDESLGLLFHGAHTHGLNLCFWDAYAKAVSRQRQPLPCRLSVSHPPVAPPPPVLCQLNAALAVDEWHAFKVIDHFCTNVLPKLSEAELVNYLRPYRLDSIDAYRCAVLTRDARYDAGFDEVPLLDASFNVHTSLFFSVGKVRAVSPDTQVHHPCTS